MHKAIVCKVTVTPHPDPEVHSLAVGTVMGETIIVGKDTPDQALGLYFPCELQLSAEFAAKNDLIRRKNPETGANEGGMFDPNRRVRVQKFRGVRSHGFWCPLSYLNHFGDTSALKEGDQIDEFAGIPICCKYISRRNPHRNSSQKPTKKKELCFPEHRDTEQLRYNIEKINIGDELIITNKVHGCVERNTKVQTLELGTQKIGDIVDLKLTVHIKARDLNTHQDIYVPIDEFYYVPNDGEWFELEFDDGSKLTITGNNPVWLPEFSVYRRVDELSIGDLCLSDE